MVELHGWVTIRETYKVTFDEEEHLDLLVKRIQDEIMKLSWFKPEIKVQNGEWFMEFSLYANRIAQRALEVFELLKYIAKIAEGSYGLIYLYDDGDLNGKENQFQVFSLARGIIREHTDSFLSPIIPTIEDKDDLN